MHLSATATGPEAVPSVQTDSFGHFLFQNVPAGQYYIWATQNGQSGRPLSWSVPAGGTGYAGTLTVLLSPSGATTPVVLVPGILGSTDTKKKGLWSPKLNKDSYSEKRSNLELFDPSEKVGWKTLKEQLHASSNGLEAGTTIIDCPWDWRDPLETAVEEYLIPAIDEAKKNSPSGKVNIIAHSMGGLLARTYIQGSKYRNDIDQLVMVGTPHKGSANMYLHLGRRRSQVYRRSIGWVEVFHGRLLGLYPRPV